MNHEQCPAGLADGLDWGRDADARLEAIARFLDIPLARNQQGQPLPVRDLDSAAEACELVAEFFSGDIGKTRLWFLTANPLLGDVEPRMMILIGRAANLLAFVRDAIQQNTRP